MHFHVPFHPNEHHLWLSTVDFMTILLIALGLLLALFIGPVRLD
jgi:hypothetical protein